LDGDPGGVSITGVTSTNPTISVAILPAAYSGGSGQTGNIAITVGSTLNTIPVTVTVTPTCGTTPTLTFVFPPNKDVIAGKNPVIWAAVDGDPVFPPQKVVFETATAANGPFVPLIVQEAPDFGPGSYSTTLDTTKFPIGPLFVRARFVGTSIGPVLPLTIHRLPQPACKVSSIEATLVKFDCSASSDTTDLITAYEFHFGDGTTKTSTSPVVTHSYSSYGQYDFGMTVSTLSDLSATLIRQLILLQGEPPILLVASTCGCQQIVLATTGDSVMPDLRRPNPNPPPPKYLRMPLGADPKYLANNFEIRATLIPGSDPDLCTEGQEVRRTAQPKNLPAIDKKACSKGRTLPVCGVDAECDTHTCAGGTQNGKSCDADQGAACKAGGGNCVANNDGKCTSYPFKGQGRGNDDYRKPFPKDDGPKIHQPGRILWLDAPGAGNQQVANVGRDYLFDADFLSFVKGPAGSCQCHFSVTIDWDDAKKAYVQPTKITLVNDADTVNCVQK
jgi:hypothetical protein